MCGCLLCFKSVGKTFSLFNLIFFSRVTYIIIFSLRSPFERLHCFFSPFLEPISQDSVISQEENPEEDKTVSVLPNTESQVSFLSLVFILFFFKP